MARRVADVHTLTCPLTADELAVADAMRARCAVDSYANLARIALWSLANEWDIDPPRGVFDCRSYEGNPANCRKANARRHADAVARQRAPKTILAHVKPAADHPWRGKKATA